MKKHTIAYTSDLHGNEVQYRKFISFAIEKSVDSAIIGGDIAPKNFKWQDIIKGQRSFLERRLPGIIRPLQENLPQAKLYLMMGNDDAVINLIAMEKEDGKLYNIIHNNRLRLNDDFEIVGYSYVPVTPFGIKDWEKYDLSKVPPLLAAEYVYRKMTNYRLEGMKSTSGRWKPFNFTPKIEREDSIQKDLQGELFQSNPKKTVYAIHTPPDRTYLDQTEGGHVGSMALKMFIEKAQPYLTLHGHIHETVEVSGQFKEKIGDTLCLASGNHNVGEDLAVLLFDLYQPGKVRRWVI